MGELHLMFFTLVQPDVFRHQSLLAQQINVTAARGPISESSSRCSVSLLCPLLLSMMHKRVRDLEDIPQLH